MNRLGQIRNGTIVLENPTGLPDGTQVEIDIREVPKPPAKLSERDIAKLAEGINYDFEAFERLREASKL